MVSSLKKTLISVIITTSIAVFLVVCHHPTRKGNIVPHEPRTAQITGIQPLLVSLNRTLETIPWEITKTDNYFKTMCANREMTIPCAKHSQLKLEKFEDGVAEVTLLVFDQTRKRSSSSDDVIFVWAEQVNGHGRVSGIVRPRGNGSYTGHVKIFWSGLTRIKAKIAESSVNTCLRYRSLLRYGNVVYSMESPWGLLGVFKSPFLQEKTRCGTTPYLHGYTNVCNFTAMNDGSPWYCGQPRSSKINCRHIYSFGTGAFRVGDVKEREKIQSHDHGTLHASVTVDSRIAMYPESTTGDLNNVKRGEVTHSPRFTLLGSSQEETIKCNMASKRNTWTRTSVSGFLGKVWEPLHCRGPSEHTNASYKTCLAGKTLVFIGDSTVRQYFEYIYKNLLHLSLPYHHGHGPGREYRSTAVLSRHNITAYFRKHELPWHMPDAPPNGIKSTASQLRDLANTDTPGHSLVIVLNYFSHMSAFPPSHYRQRMRALVESVKYLLAKKPGATVMYKSPHVCKDKSRWFDQNFALLYRDIVFEEFRDIMDCVIYLDTWDITIAHNSEKLHPDGRCMQSQMQQMMAYICE